MASDSALSEAPASATIKQRAMAGSLLEPDDDTLTWSTGFSDHTLRNFI
jgi:hypothetical protein